MKFRHELKYLINEGDAELIKQRLQVVLKPDTHTLDGQYLIRSLYFDDYWDRSYADKLSGVSSRKKYRIRLYNLDSDFIRLECKLKNGAYICKQSARLCLEEALKILNGDYGFLLQRDDALCRQFYFECVSRVMRPKVYVDYEREPYVLEAGDVRITFDRNVRGAYPGYGLTEKDMVFSHVLEPGKLVLEVKFTEFLPKIVQQILPVRAAELTAVSKYTLCRDKINYLYAKTAE